jgi:hypothetical protein
MVPLAHALRARLQHLPSHTMITDPINWASLSRARTPATIQELDQGWRRLVAESEHLAANSEPMAEEFRRLGGDPVVIHAGLEERYRLPPAPDLRLSHRLVLGFCGNRYVDDAWSALLDALDAVDWRVAGREVTIRIFGRHLQLARRRPLRIEFLGWQSERSLVRALRECDATYCPHFFLRELEPEARLMLPSKTAIFLAAGRPVLYHGPPYAALGRFLAEREAALACHSLAAAPIVAALERLATDTVTYAALARAAHDAFPALSARRMRSRLPAFLGVAPGELRSEDEIERELAALEPAVDPLRIAV